MAALVQHIPNGSVPWPHSTPGPHSSFKEEILTLSPFCYGTKVPSEGGTVEWVTGDVQSGDHLLFHTAKLHQPRSDFGVCDTDAAIPVLQELNESWRFRGYKSFGIFEIPSLFLCGYLTAGQLRQGHPSSAPSGLCLLLVGLNGKVSLGFSWAIWGSYWPQFSLV